MPVPLPPATAAVRPKAEGGEVDHAAGRAPPCAGTPAAAGGAIGPDIGFGSGRRLDLQKDLAALFGSSAGVARIDRTLEILLDLAEPHPEIAQLSIHRWDLPSQEQWVDD